MVRQKGTRKRLGANGNKQEPIGTHEEQSTEANLSHLATYHPDPILAFMLANKEHVY